MSSLSVYKRYVHAVCAEKCSIVSQQCLLSSPVWWGPSAGEGCAICHAVFCAVCDGFHFLQNIYVLKEKSQSSSTKKDHLAFSYEEFCSLWCFWFSWGFNERWMDSLLGEIMSMDKMYVQPPNKQDLSLLFVVTGAKCMMWLVICIVGFMPQNVI